MLVFHFAAECFRNKSHLWPEVVLLSMGDKLCDLQTEGVWGKEDIPHETVMSTALSSVRAGSSDVLEITISKRETRSLRGYESISYTNPIVKGETSACQKILAVNLPKWRLQDWSRIMASFQQNCPKGTSAKVVMVLWHITLQSSRNWWNLEEFLNSVATILKAHENY